MQQICRLRVKDRAARGEYDLLSSLSAEANKSNGSG